MYNVSRIWMYSGVATLIFGIIFDEWGGFNHVQLLNYFGSWVGVEVLSEPLYQGFHRMKHILELVGLTAFVGMIHLAFGFAIGAINEWKHNKKHAMAKIAWIGVEIGMLLTLLPAIGLVAMPALMYAGLAVLVISVIALAITEGILGIIELPGLLGNILSYTRIAAIGIVGIVIAEILLNQFVIPLPEHGIFALLLLPLFLLLHVVNAFIAMFESLVQGGRLNIVEFRSKFLHGGGEIFVPFSVKKEY
jgi:V/A-type H+-transporting ATPase subunit I